MTDPFFVFAAVGKGHKPYLKGILYSGLTA